MVDYSLAEETLGYTTSPDPSNIDKTLLVTGSQNVLIDYQKKVSTRSGYTRLGAENTALTEIRNAWTWVTSLGQQLPQRFYDDELEVYLQTIDGIEINVWTRILDGWSTTEMIRRTTIYDTTEKIDFQVMCIGDANLYDWSGGVAIADSVSSIQVAEAGDASNQMSSWVISGATSSNTNGFLLYWKLTDSGGTRTVNIYKDSAGSNLVASGSRVGDGSVTLSASGGSGITGSVTVAYSGDDTTVSANILTLSYTLTKKSTTTWAQNHFYTARNLSLYNVTTGQTYSYTAGTGTTTLTGVTPTTAMDIVDGDIIVQKVVTQSNKPAASRTNHFVFSFENQLVVGSEDDALIYLSQNDSYTDFTFATPRVAGEGALLTLTEPTRAINALGKSLLIFSGKSSLFKVEYQQIAVGSTLAESVAAKKLDLGINQGALNHESVVPVGNSLAFLTNEVALRIIGNPEDLVGINPRNLSNPIKPDFDAEDWDGAFGYWYKNILFFSAADGSHTYMLNFIEDADGRLTRFWNPPQILPVGAMSLIDVGDGNGFQLYGHSNSVPETYLLFDGGSDGQYTDMDVANKLPINAIATFAYNSFGKRARLKTFDEYYVEGEITPNTIDVVVTLNYDFGGATQSLEKTIDGSDEDILEGSVGFNSLAQQSLAVNPLGGLLNPPSATRKFRVVFELPREDVFQLQTSFSTNEVDRFWSIISHGANGVLSPRKPINRYQ